MNMTPQQIKDAGFLWPVETEIENHLGEKRRVKPASIRSGHVTASKREREDLRLYSDGVSEHELKMWQIGGPATVFYTFGAMKPILASGSATEAIILEEVKQQGFNDLQIKYTLGWLQESGQVATDPETGFLVDKNPSPINPTL